MNITVRSPNRKFVLIIGIPLLFIIGLLFFILYNTAISPDDAHIRKRVVLILKKELSDRHHRELEQSGKRLPDRVTAKRWEEEMQRMDKMKFLSMDVKRPLPDILLSSDSPSYVVRVEFEEAGTEKNPRYFWLSWDGMDLETSYIAWFFSM